MKAISTQVHFSSETASIQFSASSLSTLLSLATWAAMLSLCRAMLLKLGGGDGFGQGCAQRFGGLQRQLDCDPCGRSKRRVHEVDGDGFLQHRVVRMVDKARNTLVYLTYSDRLIEGSPQNSVTVVPVDRATPIPVK